MRSRCCEGFDVDKVFNGYCRKCWEGWNALDAPSPSKAAAPAGNASKVTAKAKGAAGNASKKTTQKKKPRPTQKKSKPTPAAKSASAPKSAAGQTAAKSDGPECDRAKGAALAIGTVVQGFWGGNEWPFAAVESIVWDEDPPRSGDEQWAYTLKWDDGDGRLGEDDYWYFNGRQHSMESIRVPSLHQMKKRKSSSAADQELPKKKARGSPRDRNGLKQS